MVPLLRSLISLPAGLVGMRLGRFTLLTAAGAALWNGLLGGLGYAAGVHWPQVSTLVARYERAVLAALALGIALVLARRVDLRRRRRP
jgi:membrane protein DedA with SNARE-associated domain